MQIIPAIGRSEGLARSAATSSAANRAHDAHRAAGASQADGRHARGESGGFTTARAALGSFGVQGDRVSPSRELSVWLRRPNRAGWYCLLRSRRRRASARDGRIDRDDVAGSARRRISSGFQSELDASLIVNGTPCNVIERFACRDLAVSVGSVACRLVGEDLDDGVRVRVHGVDASASMRPCSAAREPSVERSARGGPPASSGPMSSRLSIAAAAARARHSSAFSERVARRRRRRRLRCSADGSWAVYLLRLHPEPVPNAAASAA